MSRAPQTSVSCDPAAEPLRPATRAMLVGAALVAIVAAGVATAAVAKAAPDFNATASVKLGASSR